jgi:hypothetical protein
MCVFLLIKEKLATLKTHTPENLNNLVEILNEEDRTSQLNMSKIAWGLNVVITISRAN